MKSFDTAAEGISKGDIMRLLSARYIIESDLDGLPEVSDDYVSDLIKQLSKVNKEYVSADIDPNNVDDKVSSLLRMADDLVSTNSLVVNNDGLAQYNEGGANLGEFGLEVCKIEDWYNDNEGLWDGTIIVMPSNRIRTDITEEVDKIADLGHPQAQTLAIRLHTLSSIQSGLESGRVEHLQKAQHYADELIGNSDASQVDRVHGSDINRIIEESLKNRPDDFNPVAMAFQQ